ncbi:hypothetical protein ZIOFF_043078 [Zingiber officinale]|uniref:Uncharacterized protein n=1 Tax=Zingiber officinale TaxID=94328 RepID=A0A8J5FZT3_ZINOF|nr:hypothetical protein ZIOFF_043078 [Zingiber officinale]
MKSGCGCGGELEQRALGHGRYALGDDFERRMAVAENPFSTLYTRFCMNYVFVMDTGQTSSGIRQDGELDSTSLKNPGLKIIYWLEADKGDVVLKQDGNMDSDLTKRENFSIEDSCGDEELKVRTCGMPFITLGINTRTGMFLLRASKNVPSPFTLVDFEVALNQGSLSATEVYDHH